MGVCQRYETKEFVSIQRTEACEGFLQLLEKKDVRAADELWKLRRGDRKELSAAGGGGERPRDGRRQAAKFYHDIL